MKNLKFNKYETVIVLNADIKYREYEEIKTKAKSILCKVDKIEVVGIKRLPYQVKENKDGIYVIFYWVGFNETLIEVERYFSKEDNVLKYLTVKMEEGVEE